MLGQTMLCVMLSRWIEVIRHLSKIIDCSAPRVNPKVNRNSGDDDARVWGHPERGAILMSDVDSGGAYMRGGREYGNSLVLPLNFAVNLKVP